MERYRHLPLCQKKSKQFCFFGDEHVIKGPYSEEKLVFIREVYGRLKEMGARHLTPPVKEEDGYLFFKNRARRYREDTPVVEGVIQRTGLVKLGDVILNIDLIHRLRRDYLEECFINMCLAYILEVSDIGLYNTLVNVETGKVYLIDLDDRRIQEHNTPEWFYFMRSPQDEKLRVWLRLVRPYYPRARHKLGEIGREDLARLFPEEPPSFLRLSGPFSSVSPSGFTMDVVKSTIQKMIRRGKPDAVHWVREMFLMEEGLEKKPLRSNLLNRVAVIAMEDVGVANPALVLEVFSFLSGDYHDVMLDGLLPLVMALAQSPKIRLCSHVKAAASRCGVEPSLERLDELLTDVSTRTWQPRDLVLAYTAASPTTGKVELRRHWSALLKHRAELEPLRDFHLNHGRTLKESPYFLILGALLAMVGIDGDATLPAAIPPQKGPLPFPPSEAYDMHTKLGKMMGRGTKHFLEVSSVVLNEDPRYDFPALKEAYQASKR